MGNPPAEGNGEPPTPRGSGLIRSERTTELRTGALDDVEFEAAGEQAGGEYRCAECGYGITVWTTLPRCPMCSGGSWEQTAWPRPG